MAPSIEHDKVHKFRNSIPCTTSQSLADAHCSSEVQYRCQYRRNPRLVCKVNFAPGKIMLGGNSPTKFIYSVPAQETAKHRAVFGWLQLNDVGSVTKPRRETRWNLLTCPKHSNRCQPLVCRSLPYCEDTWRRYCCLFRLSIYTLRGWWRWGNG